MVTLRVTLAVPNLLNTTVAENKLLSEAGVFDSVQAKFQSDVVWTKSLSESLMLELDLGLWHGGVSTIVIAKVDDPVANSFGGTELPVVVVAQDCVCVVAGCQAAGWRQERRDKFLFRDRSGDDSRMEASFVWSPQLFHLKVKSKIQQYLNLTSISNVISVYNN